ncbi:MAG: hypothetical protein JKY52_02790 [Flavobacteriales bacterium]|nr:hypothetical protein [Flavobacteriales bacterium]
MDVAKGDSNTYLSLEKGGCLAHCKAYTISIERNGSANYLGRVNVSKTGRYHRKLTSKENVDLWEFIEKSAIFDFNGFTGHLGEDSQARTLIISLDGSVKKITYGAMAPKILIDLEEKMEAIAESGEWKE